jgi:hypothetical protein
MASVTISNQGESSQIKVNQAKNFFRWCAARGAI